MPSKWNEFARLLANRAGNDVVDAVTQFRDELETRHSRDRLTLKFPKENANLSVRVKPPAPCPPRVWGWLFLMTFCVEGNRAVVGRCYIMDRARKELVKYGYPRVIADRYRSSLGAIDPRWAVGVAPRQQVPLGELTPELLSRVAHAISSLIEELERTTVVSTETESPSGAHADHDIESRPRLDAAQDSPTQHPVASSISSQDTDAPSVATIDELARAQKGVEEESFWDASDLEDARHRIYTSIVRRRGQHGFRQSLLVAYDHKCAMTGCDVEDALEAAHISPYRGDYTDTIENGLLLRCDIHTLFDLMLISVDPNTETIYLAPQLRGSHYEELDGRRLRDAPHLSWEHRKKRRETLGQHYDEFRRKWSHGTG